MVSAATARPTSALCRCYMISSIAACVAIALIAPAEVCLAGSDEPASSSEESVWSGLRLDHALLELERRGLRIVFSDNVVRPEMLVRQEPTSTDLRQLLNELLLPHGLVAREGPGETMVIVPGFGGLQELEAFATGVIETADGSPIVGARIRCLDSGVEASSDELGRFAIPNALAGERTTLEVRAAGFLVARVEEVTRASKLTIRLDPVPVFDESVVVSPSRLSLLRDVASAPLGLSRDEIETLPHLGGDFYRALTLLPGATSNDVSAQFHIRGGRRDETQILLDGQELYDAFHLKDRDSAMSFIAPGTVGGADLATGGFSAEFGDRMSGVLDMTTVDPEVPRHYRLGLGVLSVSLGSSGLFSEDRGGWMVEARRGTTDLVGELLGDEDPWFWDLFGKLEIALGPQQSLRLNLLATGDELDFEEVVEDESKRFKTEYESSYAWLTHQGVLGPSLAMQTALSAVQIERDRRGRELEEGARFDILDERDSQVLDLRQAWDSLLKEGYSLRLGWQVREFETEYRYLGLRELDDPLAVLRHDYGDEVTALDASFTDRQSAIFLAGRLQPLAGTTVELGMRWDRQSLTDESFVSPRFNAVRAIGRGGVVRLAWGRYNQSQRTYELDVEDGDRVFYPVERSEHRILGCETQIGGKDSARDLVVRIEVYQRDVGNPRPRYENLFEPLNTFPEVEPDRVLVEPTRSLAEGVELFLRGGLGSRVHWWANYSWASTEDRIDGSWTPRLFDETHRLNLDLDWLVGSWRLNAAWRYHTGWPTTPLDLVQEVDDEGEIEYRPVLGPLNSERVSDYHRLDVRVSRTWPRRWGSATFYVDVQNLYDRQNVAGFDIEIDDEEGTLQSVSETWAGILPSAGIRFDF